MAHGAEQMDANLSRASYLVATTAEMWRKDERDSSAASKAKSVFRLLIVSIGLFSKSLGILWWVKQLCTFFGHCLYRLPNSSVLFLSGTLWFRAGAVAFGIFVLP